MRGHHAATGQQSDDHGDTEDELERGPEHAHELDQAEGAADVALIQRFKEPDLGLLAGEGSDQAGAGEVLLGLRGDLAEAGLDALEALVDAVAEELDEEAGQRHRSPGQQGQPGADAQQEEERADGEEDRVGRVHQGRAEQHADRVEVVGHAGHDVAGAVVLIEAGVLGLELAEEVVAQVELDLAGDADEDPALGVEEDALGDRNQNQDAGELKDGGAGGLLALERVCHALEHAGKLDPDGVGANAGERAPEISPAVTAHVGVEGGEFAQHGSIVRGVGYVGVRRSR